MTCSSHFQLKHCAAFIYFGSELLLSPCYVIKSQLNLFSTLKRNSWVSLLGRLQQQQLSELLGLFVREARCLNPPLHPPILCYLFSDTEYNISADPNPTSLHNVTPQLPSFLHSVSIPALCCFSFHSPQIDPLHPSVSMKTGAN